MSQLALPIPPAVPPALRDHVTFTPDFLAPVEADTLLEHALHHTPWQQDDLVMFGRRVAIPRLHCWLADGGETYAWSGLEMRSVPFSPPVRAVLERIRAHAGVAFDSALANLYRDGADSVGWHADDEPELGPAPVIASLSLGETRRFLLRRKRGDRRSHAWELTHGSLLLMRGSVQRDFEHSVPKTKKPRGPRVNLTFRRLARE